MPTIDGQRRYCWWKKTNPSHSLFNVIGFPMGMGLPRFCEKKKKWEASSSCAMGQWSGPSNGCGAFKRKCSEYVPFLVLCSVYRARLCIFPILWLSVRFSSKRLAGCTECDMSCQCDGHYGPTAALNRSPRTRVEFNASIIPHSEIDNVKYKQNV